MSGPAPTKVGIKDGQDPTRVAGVTADKRLLVDATPAAFADHGELPVGAPAQISDLGAGAQATVELLSASVPWDGVPSLVRFYRHTVAGDLRVISPQVVPVGRGGSYSSSRVHKFLAGETLWGLASQAGVQWEVDAWVVAPTTTPGSGSGGGSGGGLELQEGIFQARLQRDSTTQISLQAYGGRQVDVNAVALDVSAGLTRLNTDNLIDASGADAASAPAASTLYYVYASNASASFSASSIRLSATPPTLYHGSYYLGTSGNALNWRFTGWVRLDGAGHFLDDAANRYVVNYYNRHKLVLQRGEFSSTASWSGAATDAYRPWNGDSRNAVNFIANGEDHVWLEFISGCSGGFEGRAIGIGLDSTSASAAKGDASSVGSDFHSTMKSIYDDVPAVGYHSLTLLEASHSAGTTWNGSAAILSGVTVPYGAVGWVMG